jgi:hypothetical protein
MPVVRKPRHAWRRTPWNKIKVTFKEWWRDARPTKTVVFWSWIGSVVLTIRIGENRFVEAKCVRRKTGVGDAAR